MTKLEHVYNDLADTIVEDALDVSLILINNICVNASTNASTNKIEI